MPAQHLAVTHGEVSIEYKNLGRTGLKVSRLGLGTMNFGMETSEADSFAVLDAALEAGINYVDTADVYGGPQSPDMAQGWGISEEFIGRWRRSGRGDRPGPLFACLPDVVGRKPAVVVSCAHRLVELGRQRAERAPVPLMTEWTHQNVRTIASSLLGSTQPPGA